MSEKEKMKTTIEEIQEAKAKAQHEITLILDDLIKLSQCSSIEVDLHIHDHPVRHCTVVSFQIKISI